MTNFVYFDSETLEIKWQSDRSDVMQFPTIESEALIYTPNFRVVQNEDDGTYSLEAIQNQYTDEEWEEITNP